MKPFLDAVIREQKDLPEMEPVSRRTTLAARDVQEVKRQCPPCSSAMNKVNYFTDSNIIIDRCPSCEGVWVDRDDLERLAIYRKGNRHIKALAEGLEKDLNRREDMTMIGEMGTVLSDHVCTTSLIIPISDEQECRTIPFIRYTIIALNILVFIYQRLFVSDLDLFFREFGFIPARKLSLSWLSTIFTSAFVHGGFLHIFVNMYFFWIFGDNVEDALGHVRFLFFYLACIAGSILFDFFFYAHSTAPAIGASGAISGVIGCYLVLHPRAKLRFFLAGRDVKVFAGFYLCGWIALQLFSFLTLSVLDRPPFCGWAAHIGGFFTSAAIGWIAKRKLPVKESDGANLSSQP